MELPYERTVSKLRFKRIRLCLKLIKFDSLARTDSLLPAFLHKEGACSLKFAFLLISKPNNFYLLLSQSLFVPYISPSILIFISRNEQVTLILD